MRHQTILVIGKIYNFAKYIFPPIIWNNLIFMWRIVQKKPTNVGFQGWGMTTEITDPPWVAIAENDVHYATFISIQNQIETLVKAGDFVWEVRQSIALSRGLMWRHYFVYWSTQYALSKNGSRNLVECGVGDGFTSFFALSTAEKSGASGITAYLYDAWGPMKEEGIIDGESAKVGKYEHLDIVRAKKNLSFCNVNKTFNPGFIPDSFVSAENPEDVCWVHIDLNALKPTLAALEFFYDKLSVSGVILFDDYGWSNYRHSKIGIDKFFQDKNGVFLPLPTGQAIFFKNG